MAEPAPTGVVTEAELACLPAPGARYLRRCGGAGLPRVGSFRAGVRDGAQTITAELVFDDAGDLVDFASDDRPRTATGRRDRTSFAGPVRVEGPVARGGWGRPVPGR